MGKRFELMKYFALRALFGFVLVAPTVFPKATVATLVALSAFYIITKRPSVELRSMIAPLLLAGLAVASAAWSIEPHNTLVRAGQCAGIMALWWSIRSLPLSCTPQEREGFSRLFLLGWLSALALLLSGLLLKMVPNGFSDVSRFLAFHFVSKNGAVVLTMMAFPALALVLRKGMGLVLAALVVALLFLVILSSDSSSALFGLVAGLAMWGWHARFPKSAGWVLACGLPALFLAMPLLLGHIDAVAAAKAVPHFPTSFFHRMTIWEFVRQRIAERPWLGWGFDASRAVPGGAEKFFASFPVPWSSEPYHETGQYLPLHPHNAALQVWLELGAIGALSIAFLLWRIVRSQVLRSRDGTESVMAGSLAAAMSISFVAYGVAQAWWLALLVMTWAAIKTLPPSSSEKRQAVQTMTQEVRFSIPKKHALRDFLINRFPRMNERWLFTRWKIKDRAWHLLQGDLFDRLDGKSAMPGHIEIETINSCNGTCSFCPVNRASDPRKTIRMSEELFYGIIDELKEWGFAGTLNLFSNNEPFLDKRIFQFAEYARQQLPDVYLQIISNGTLLNAEKVETILGHVSNLVINHYADDYVLRPNIQETVDHLHANHPDIAGKLNIGYRLNKEVKTNRAGNAPNRSHRKANFRSRCAYPFFQMVIRPDGKVSMCCNDALGQATLGDVAADGVRKAWASQERLAIQKSMRQGRDKIPLCTNCDNLAWARPKRVAKFIKQGNDRRLKDEG